MAQREANQEKPLVMSDALTSNEAGRSDADSLSLFGAGRRKFSELEDVFPDDADGVEASGGFDHEDKAPHSRSVPRSVWRTISIQCPIMEGLKRWLAKQFDDRLVEPNSRLGKAIAYLGDTGTR